MGLYMSKESHEPYLFSLLRLGFRFPFSPEFTHHLRDFLGKAMGSGWIKKLLFAGKGHSVLEGKRGYKREQCIQKQHRLL